MSTPQASSNTDAISKSDRAAAGSQPDNSTPTGGEVTPVPVASVSSVSGSFGITASPTTGAVGVKLTTTASTRRLWQSDSNSAAPAWAASTYFDCFDFGLATGNSASANTTAIQAALTAAGSGGGGVVLIGPGSFAVNTGLTIPTINGSIVVKGCGGRSTWLQVAGTGTLFAGGYGSQKNVTLEDFGCIYGTQQTTTSFISYTAGWGLTLNRLLVFNCGHFLTVGTDQVGAPFNYLWVTDCNVQGNGGILFNLIGSMGALYFRGNYAQSAQAGSKILTHTGTHTPDITSLFMVDSDYEQFTYGILFEYGADGGVTDAFLHNLIVGNGISASHGISFKTAGAPAFRIGNVVLSNIEVNVSGTNFHAINFDSDYHSSAFGVGACQVRGCINVGASGGGDGIHVGAATEIIITNNQVNTSTNGIHVTSGAGFVDIQNNRVGLVTGCTVGMLLDSGAAGGIVTGNDLRGNSTALTNNWGANSSGVRYVATNLGVDV